MAQKKTRLIKMYLLPEEMRRIRIAAAEADVPLSTYARVAVLGHVATNSEPTAPQKSAAVQTNAESPVV